MWEDSDEAMGQVGGRVLAVANDSSDKKLLFARLTGALVLYIWIDRGFARLSAGIPAPHQGTRIR